MMMAGMGSARQQRRTGAQRAASSNREQGVGALAALRLRPFCWESGPPPVSFDDRIEVPPPRFLSI